MRGIDRLAGWTSGFCRSLGWAGMVGAGLGLGLPSGSAMCLAIGMARSVLALVFQHTQATWRGREQSDSVCYGAGLVPGERLALQRCSWACCPPCVSTVCWPISIAYKCGVCVCTPSSCYKSFVRPHVQSSGPAGHSSYVPVPRFDLRMLQGSDHHRHHSACWFLHPDRRVALPPERRSCCFNG